MCAICHFDQCPGACPNADPEEDRDVILCALCNQPLEEGDEYFTLQKKPIHLCCGSENFEEVLERLEIYVEDFYEIT